MSYVENEPRTAQLEEKMVSPQASPTSSPPRMVSPRSSSSSNAISNIESTMDSDPPPRKVKSLSEIYGKCTFALLVTEPMSYDEACGKDEWENSMKEEIASIEKNYT